MDFAEKLSVIYSDISKQTSADKARELLSGLVDDIVWQIQKEGKEVSVNELHFRLDEFYIVAKSNRDKDGA
jgi:hypothetical protein